MLGRRLTGKRLIAGIAALLLVTAVMPLAAQAPDPTITMMMDRDSLTLHVGASGPVSLNGMQLLYVRDGNKKVVSLSDYFDILILAPDTISPNACFRLVIAGRTPPLPSICSDMNHVYMRSITQVDQFWYDNVANQFRTLTLAADSEGVAEPCPLNQACPRVWPQRPITEGDPPTVEPAQPVDQLPQITENREWVKEFATFGDIQTVLVPPGCFNMGSSTGMANVQSVHHQCIEQPFWLGRYEVSNQEYGLCVQAGVCAYSNYFLNYPEFSSDGQPVIGLTYADVQRYLDWMSDETGYVWRLPTEAEWEYAARGPSNLAYPWGNNFIPSVVNIENTRPALVYDYSPSGDSWVGAANMAGNVWEWTSTIFSTGYPYPYDPNDGRENTADDRAPRTVRGGSWRLDQYSAASTARFGYSPDHSHDEVGFRVVVEAPVE
jgi:formylglycine-generating enzyme required for sulfatase activity